MNAHEKRGESFFANKLHKSIFFFVVLSCLLPTVVVSITLYFLIFGVTANQIGLPDVIAHHILPAAKQVLIILLISIPILIAAILVFAYKLTHQIIGPFDRIVREMDDFLSGKKHGHINLRDDDKFWPLVNRVNTLLDKLEETQQN